MPRIIISDITATPEQFQELHGKGLFLGGSEIATAAGLNKFSSPLKLWMVKTGRDVSVIDNWHTFLGKEMEPVACKAFMRTYPEWKIAKKIDTTYQHDTIDWATCTPDYVLSDVDYGVDLWKEHANTLLEIKTSGIWAKSEWEDGKAPDYALIQLQWQMGICGVERGYLAALIGGKDFYVKEVPFNKDVFSQLLELGEKFLGYVQSDTPPDATYSDDMSFIKPKEKQVELSGCLEMVKEFVVLSEEISTANSLTKLKEQARETLKNKLIQQLGDANLGVCGDYQISRKIIPIKESVRKAYEQIRFSIKNTKEKND